MSSKCVPFQLSKTNKSAKTTGMYSGRTRGKRIDYAKMLHVELESSEDEGETRETEETGLKCRECGKKRNEDDLWVECSGCRVNVHHACLDNVVERMDAELSLVDSECVFLCGECQVPVCLCECCGMKGPYDKDVWVRCENGTCGASFHYNCLPDRVLEEIALCESRQTEWFCRECCL